MSRIRTIRYVLVSALVTVLLVAQGAAALAQPAPPTLRNATCEQVRTSIPSAGDGNYLLFTERAIVSVYCHDMAGTPREYLTLANTGADSNFSQYTAGGASPGTDVRTTFTRLRVDPATLTVDIGDLTFAESTGSLTHSGQETVSSMPYGVAMSCTGGPDGTANVNLSGTPFTVTDTFSTGGFGVDGSEDRSANGQVIDLNGGGFCGWIAPDPFIYNPFNPQPGDFRLELDCAANNFTKSGICLSR